MFVSCFSPILFSLIENPPFNFQPNRRQILLAHMDKMSKYKLPFPSNLRAAINEISSFVSRTPYFIANTHNLTFTAHTRKLMNNCYYIFNKDSRTHTHYASNFRGSKNANVFPASRLKVFPTNKDFAIQTTREQLLDLME